MRFIQHRNFMLNCVEHEKTFIVFGACPDSKLSLRDSGCFTIPELKGFGQKSFSYKGISLWNALPQHVRDSENLKVFETRLEIHMM